MEEEDVSDLQNLPLDVQEQIHSQLIGAAYDEGDSAGEAGSKRKRNSDSDDSDSETSSSSSDTDFGIVSFPRYFDSDEEGFEKRIKCRFCFQKGHRYANCPNRIIKCHLCNEKHFPSRCPLILRVCWFCGMMGHNKNQCHNKLLFNRNFCDYCDKGGHNEMTCSFIWRTYRLTKRANNAKTITLRESTRLFCAHCASPSHLADDCPRPSIPYGRNHYTPTIYSRSFVESIRTYNSNAHQILESVKINPENNMPMLRCRK